MKDSLGDRMKGYEGTEAKRRCDPLLPICIRIDGHNFSSWTKGLQRPFDARLSHIMQQTTLGLVQEFGACIGYTQSDEISLIIYSGDVNTETIHGGRYQKLVSRSASTATRIFNDLLKYHIPDWPSAEFDSRVWTVPNLEEASNTILWRELDAVKNSKSMAARHYYSHKQLLNKNGDEMVAMLSDKGVLFEDYPDFFKRGSYVCRRRSLQKFSTEEIEKLPAKHEARTNPDLMVERSIVNLVSMPPFMTISNRVGVLLGELPQATSY